MRDNAAPAKARRYTPFAHIAFLRMRSDYDDGDGADLPTALEDNNEGGDAATSDWNWHKAKSAGRARRGSATAPPSSSSSASAAGGVRGGGRASSSSTTMMLSLLSTSLC